MQIAMNDLLKSDLFFNVLKINHLYTRQAVHQTLYLKNILGKDCGLDHEESVDLFSRNNICPRLYMYNRDYFLKVFFYYLSKTVVSSLRKSFQELGLKLKIQTQNLLTDYFTQNKISLEKSWTTKEAPFHICFSGEESKVPLNLATLQRCLFLIPLESHLWNEEGKLTQKGIEDFSAFLVEEKQDPSIILPSGEITEASMVPFLQFVQDYTKECAIERVYSRQQEKLTEVGRKLFLEEMQKPSSSLYRIMRASFNQLNIEGKEWNKFIEDVVDKLKNYRSFRETFFHAQGIYKKPWSLEQEDPSYELSEFGALALLEKEGYLQIDDSYEKYLKLQEMRDQLTKVLEKISLLRFGNTRMLDEGKVRKISRNLLDEQERQFLEDASYEQTVQQQLNNLQGELNSMELEFALLEQNDKSSRLW
jgi:hypothetical protein